MRALALLCLLAVSGCSASPAFARHHHAPAAPAPTFWSIFQLQEEPRAHTTRIHVRHIARHRVRAVHGAPAVTSHLGSDSVVEAARHEIGNGPVYGRRSLWCARFMNWVLEHTGHQGTGSDMARSFSKLPHTDMHVGAIAVLSRRGGGHVGVVSGVTPSGDPVVISGNHGRRVRESVYPRSRVITFVNPS